MQMFCPTLACHADKPSSACLSVPLQRNLQVVHQALLVARCRSHDVAGPRPRALDLPGGAHGGAAAPRGLDARRGHVRLGPVALLRLLPVRSAQGAEGGGSGGAARHPGGGGRRRCASSAL